MRKIVSAIVPAAGMGERLGGDTPKQFLLLGGRPMLAWSAAVLVASPAVAELIVGVAPEMVEPTRAMLASPGSGARVKIVPGGSERQRTVMACLAAVSPESELVVVHDAARPFATVDLIERTITAAANHDAATAALRPVDSIKSEREAAGVVVRENLRRDRLWQIQTPQAFGATLIKSAHERAAREGLDATDDTALVESMGVVVEMVTGASMNMKITTPDDWRIAQALVGSGVVEPARDHEQKP